MGRDLSDLISKSALKEEIENGKNKPTFYDGIEEVFWMKECIEKAPPAFDLERVIKQVEELDVYHDNDYSSNNKEPMLLKKDILDLIEQCDPALQYLEKEQEEAERE